MNKETKYNALDYLRVVAMILVVFNHTWGYFSSDLSWENQKLQNGVFYLDSFLNSITRINVPLFLMISGALILPKYKNQGGGYILKKICTIIKILFITTLVYTIINYFIIHDNILLNLCKSIFRTNYYAGHLWYLYTTVVIYLLTPFISNIINDSFKRKLFIFIYFTYGIIFPFINNYVPIAKLENSQNIMICSGYIGLYGIGGILFHNDKQLFINRKCLLFLFFIALLFCNVFEFFIQFIFRKYDNYLYSFSSPFIVIMSIAFFCFFINTEFPKSKLISFLSKISLDVYLVHYLITRFGKYIAETIDSIYVYEFIFPIVNTLISIILGIVIFFIRNNCTKLKNKGTL